MHSFTAHLRAGLVFTCLALPALRAQTSVLPSTFSLGGSTYATLSSVAVTGQSFTTAQRVAVTTKPANVHDVLLQANTTATVAKGDLLIATFYLRRGVTATNPALANAIFEQGASPYAKSLAYPVEAVGDWRKYTVPFLASAAYAAGAAKFDFQLGQAVQTVDIGGVQVVNYGNKSLYGATDPLTTFSLSAVSGAATMSTVAVTGQTQFTQALRVQTTALPTNEWDLRIISSATGAITAGDTLVALFYLRDADTTTGDAGARLVVEGKTSPYTKSTTPFVSAGTAWRQFALPFKAAETYAAGGNLRYSFNLSYQAQTLELGGFQLVNLGTALKPSDLTAILNYQGREWNAGWRATAAANIDLNRKANLVVAARNGSGGALATATLGVQQTEHAFGFGTAINSRIYATGTDADTYRANLKNYFNKVVFEGWSKWPEWEANSADTTGAINWLLDNGIWDIRSHNLVWPRFGVTSSGYRYMPADLDALTGQTLRDRILNHISGQPSGSPASVTDNAGVKGYIRDTDVLNEPFTNHDVQDRLADYTVEFDWFTRARAGDAKPRLFLNDYRIEGGFGYQAHQDYTYARVAAIKASGAPIDGVGLQSHFDVGMPGMDEFKTALDRFGTQVATLQITEFDHGLDDRELQADYLRDYLTMAFSHPQMDAFLMWGFWDGAHWFNNAPLYDASWNLKPSGKVWMDLVYGAWWTTASATTNASGNATVRAFKGDHRLTLTSGGVSKNYDTRLTADRTVYPVFATGAPTLCGVDLGAPAAAGSTNLSGTTWTLTGSGALYGTADTCHYAAKLMTGDGTLIVRVASISNSSTWAKAGLMVRNTLASDSAYYAFFATTANGLCVQNRPLAGDATGGGGSYAGVAAPYWLKITRVGNVFTSYRSPTGATWSQVGSPTTIRMNQIAYIGLFESSNNTTLGTATFTNVTMP